MIVGVDETGHDQLVGCVDHLEAVAARDVGASGEAGLDGGDARALNQDIGGWRPVKVGAWPHDKSARNQQ